MPVGMMNLFSATDPKLVIYNYATSFFGGVAPLVSVHHHLRLRVSASSYAYRQLLFRTCTAVTLFAPC